MLMLLLVVVAAVGEAACLFFARGRRAGDRAERRRGDAPMLDAVVEREAVVAAMMGDHPSPAALALAVAVALAAVVAAAVPEVRLEEAWVRWWRRRGEWAMRVDRSSSPLSLRRWSPGSGASGWSVRPWSGGRLVEWQWTVERPSTAQLGSGWVGFCSSWLPRRGNSGSLRHSW